MKLIISWPNWNTRLDRFLMFASTSNWLNEVYLITSEQISPIVLDRISSKCQIIYVGSSKHSYNFALRAVNSTIPILNEAKRKKEPVIIQEIALTRVLPTIRANYLIPNSLVKGVLSLYSPTPSMFLNKRWRRSANERLSVEQELRHIKSNLQKQLYEFLSCQFVDAVTGNSEQIQSDVVNYYLKHSRRKKIVKTMPAEVDTVYFSPSSSLITRESRPFILYCGKLLTRKGIIDFIKLAAYLKNQGINIDVLAVGENSIEKYTIYSEILDYDVGDIFQIRPQQPRDEIRRLLREALLLVHPSYIEGCPRIVKEAMSCGCPVVTYDIPGTRMLDNSGRALCLIPPGDLNGLGLKVQQLILNEDKRLEMGKEARKIVEQSYSIMSVAERMAKLYQSLFEANDA